MVSISELSHLRVGLLYSCYFAVPCYSHLVRDQVGTVEANTELSNHGDVATSCHGLHESLGPRLCNGSQVIDQLVLGHANARVLNGQGRVGLVRNDLDEEVGLCLHRTRLIILDNCRPSSHKRRLKTRSNHSSQISCFILHHVVPQPQEGYLCTR